MITGHRDQGDTFSVSVIRRILYTLQENGIMKRTNLASKTGLNYAACLRYLRLLNALGWVKISDDKGMDAKADPVVGSQVIALTFTGNKMRQLLSAQYKDGRARSDISHNNHNNNSDFGPGEEGRSSSSGQDIRAENEKVEGRIPTQSLEMMHTVKAVLPDKSNLDQTLSHMRTSNNIMLVDDEPDVLYTYKVFLAEHGGFNVDVFTDGNRALKQLKAVPINYYALIITDIRMKAMNGFQFYKALKSINPNTKVLFVTAFDAFQEISTIMPELKEFGFVKKPAKLEDLLGALKAILAHEPNKSREDLEISVKTGLMGNRDMSLLHYDI